MKPASQQLFRALHVWQKRERAGATGQTDALWVAACWEQTAQHALAQEQPDIAHVRDCLLRARTALKARPS